MQKLAKSASVLLLVGFALVATAQTIGRRRTVTAPPPPPPAPTAANDSYSAERGQSLTVPAPGVLVNDFDLESKPLSAVLTSSTTHGTVTLNTDGSFTYANDGSNATSDQFTYQASNGTVRSASATVTFTIIDPPPVAVADSFTLTSATGASTVAAPGVLANDTRNNGTIISYGATTGNEQTAIGSSTPTSHGGSIVLNADGSFTYTPAGTFNASDAFTYVLQNGTGSSTTSVVLNPPAQTAPDFTVASPGFFFTFSGVNGQNPVLTLKRGRTYRFQVNTDDIHPFEIVGAPAGSVQSNNISFGVVTFAVPATAQNYNYKCSIHGFGNVINTTP